MLNIIMNIKKIGYNYYLLKPIKKENLNDILDEYIK